MYQEREITPMLVFATFSAVLGLFQFGFNTGVINTPKKVLEDYLATVYRARTGRWMTEELRDILWSLTVSIFAIGGMIGGLVAPIAANWCGRKTGLVLNNTIAVLGITLMSSSELIQSIECLVAGRFFIGLNCGLNTALVPLYLSEIASTNLRGALITVGQLGATIGLIFSQVLGLKEILGTKDHWPFLFGFGFVPAILQLLMLPFCPESPRYLLLNCGRLSEARMSLRRLRATPDIEHDIEEIRAEEQHELESSLNNNYSNSNSYHVDTPSNSNSRTKIAAKLSTSFRELLETPHIRTPLLIAIMMQLSQQLSGMQTIFYFSTDIFLWEEVPESLAVYATIGVGAIMVLITLISIPLMDRVGRRTLHLYGLAGMFLAGIFLTISLLVKFLYEWMKYISVISTLFYTLFYAIGPASIPYLISSELFTQSARPAAMSVAVFVNWFANFMIAISFPILKRLLQSYLFLPFTMFMAIFWIIVYKKLPETKNRSFEEIATLFKPLQIDPRSPAFYTGNNQNNNNHVTTNLNDNSGAPPTSNATPRVDHFTFDEAILSSGMKQQQHQQQQVQHPQKHYQLNQASHYGGSGPVGPPPPPPPPLSSVGCCHEQTNRNSNQMIGNNALSNHDLQHNSCTSMLANDQQPLIVSDEAMMRPGNHGKWCTSTRNSAASSSQQQLTPTSSAFKTTSFIGSRINGAHIGHVSGGANASAAPVNSSSACCTCSTSSATTTDNNKNNPITINCDQVADSCNQHRRSFHQPAPTRHRHLTNCEFDDDDELEKPNWFLHHHSSHHHLNDYEDCDNDLEGDSWLDRRYRSKTLNRRPDISATLGRIDSYRNSHSQQHRYSITNSTNNNRTITTTNPVLNDKLRNTFQPNEKQVHRQYSESHHHRTNDNDDGDDSGSDIGIEDGDVDGSHSHCFRRYANYRASIGDLDDHNHQHTSTTHRNYSQSNTNHEKLFL